MSWELMGKRGSWFHVCIEKRSKTSSPNSAKRPSSLATQLASVACAKFPSMSSPAAMCFASHVSNLSEPQSGAACTNCSAAHFIRIRPGGQTTLPASSLNHAAPAFVFFAWMGECRSTGKRTRTATDRHSGGIRGIIELAVLRTIEKELGGLIPVQNFFDLIVGTRCAP